MIKVSIIGGSGYAGGELIRLLLTHPKVCIKQVTSRQFAGSPVSLIHPNLRGQTDLAFTTLEKLEKCDVLFVSLPNGKSMEIMEHLQTLATNIIDLGADFRLSSVKLWSDWYKVAHQAPSLVGKFVYGVPEINRSKIKKSHLIAGPGCEAIVSILSLWPLIKNKAIEPEPIIIDAKMGSSQAGSKPSLSTHHTERSRVVRSYEPTGHRHAPEIEQALLVDSRKPKVSISATAIEIVRGLLVTIHTFLKPGITEKEIWQIYRKEYGEEPFIRIVKQSAGLYRYPEPKILQGTNFCEIGFEEDPYSNRLVVIGAIDNLVKGTSGNGVQCMNIMYGFRETLGLEFAGLHPI